MTPLRRAGALIVTVAALVLVAPPPAAVAGGDWNDSGIAWESYEQGLAKAKTDKKPVCLVLYTDWCPHCTNYSRVFHDAAIVARAKDFVMIRINKDQHAEISKKHAPDGEYIPRTYFLSSAGVLDASISAPRAQYRYFYDEADPKSLLAGMDAALTKLKN
jgi:thioredoxin-like negative regulator of GroEL